MAKLKLDFEYDYKFALIGISCHEKEYRLSWALNNALNFNLKKADDLEVNEKTQEDSRRFSLYQYEEEYSQFYLLTNRNDSGILIPEHKQADYFLLVKGSFLEEQKETVLGLLRKLDMILTVFEINVDQMKSKEKLMF